MSKKPSPSKPRKPAASDTPCVFVCGRRRSGKSAWVKRYVSSQARVLIWDATGEYGRDVPTAQVFTDPVALVRALTNRAGVFAFNPPSLSWFPWFCSVALAWRSCVVVIEELASVTPPGKAPGPWGDVIRLSAHHHLTVIGITQRPQEVDKTLLGNASVIHCAPLSRADDVAYMAREIRVKPDELDALQPLHFLEYDTATRKITRGKLTF